MLKSSIARDYRKKFPKAPTKSLARKVYEENVSVYKDTEDARTFLRIIEGKHGTAARKQLTDKSLVLEGERPRNPFKLPESEEIEYKPFILPKQCSNILLLSDLHIPYHSIEGITAAMTFGKEKKIDTIILNGDLIDMYQMSRFEKDPRKRNFKYELDATRSFLSTLRREFPEALIYYKGGNHDIRLQKYLMIKAPELLDCEEFELPTLLRLNELKIKWIDDKTIIKLLQLNILHGHEFIGGVFAPVNVARGLFLRGKAIAVQGHNHKSSEHCESTLNGDMITTWSTGCLCELHPHYLPINNWNLGFAHIITNGKTFELFNKKVKNGVVF